MKFSPALLLAVLIALGGVAAFLLPAGGSGGAETKTGLDSGAARTGTETVEDLKKQIDLLLGQNEYLQGQVDVLQEENAGLIQKLGTLGMKGVAKMEPATPGNGGIVPDFVGMGVEMMKFRKIQALPLVTTPSTPAQVEAAILKWLRAQQPGDEAVRFARALAALGWIPEEIDPLPLRAKMMTLQLGGWYDAETDAMLTVDPKSDPPPALKPDEPLAIAFGQLLREYGAVLFQPQHGPLSTDARLARESLIVGDAGLTRFLFSLQNPTAEPGDQIPAEDPDHPLNQVPMPVYLRELSSFPFLRGFEFAQTLHSAGEFAQLNAAYSRPPVSTSEVIDPEAYLDTTPPAAVEVSFPDVKLGGVEPFWDDRLGKFACVTALRAHNTDEDAALGARGLLADRLLAWKAAEAGVKRHHAAWQTLWMDTETAEAFFKAMSNSLKQRYDAGITAGGDGDLAFAAQGRFVRLKRNRSGSEVLLIDAGSDTVRTDLHSLLDGVTKP
ncbi:MAG: hypothetical protein JNG86_18625 [Verrucomicrobiaceae bacterium]|nr:hypothetical protein [Verrucomicrobiaceae bacterium]